MLHSWLLSLSLIHVRMRRIWYSSVCSVVWTSKFLYKMSMEMCVWVKNTDCDIQLCLKTVSVCIVPQVNEFSNVSRRFSLSPNSTSNLCLGYSTSWSQFAVWMRLTSWSWWFLISISSCSSEYVCISVR